MENKRIGFHFEYINENEFRKKERSVRKYNMLAYKRLTFQYYPSIREGNFLGKLVSTSKQENTATYELKLPTDALFSKVHGDVVLHYTVYYDSNDFYDSEEFENVIMKAFNKYESGNSIFK